MSILVYGAGGWIGGKIVELLRQNHPNYHIVEGKARLENIDQLEKEVNEIQSSEAKLLRVINCAGRTGTPNVDWCENNRDETVISNIVGPILLASVLQRQTPPIHLTYIGSGCIYEYDETHKMPSLQDAANPGEEILGFREEDAHNYFGSFYSFTKSTVENV
jgi:3,5-epimerase/4-reductase